MTITCPYCGSASNLAATVRGTQSRGRYGLIYWCLNEKCPKGVFSEGTKPPKIEPEQKKSKRRKR